MVLALCHTERTHLKQRPKCPITYLLRVVFQPNFVLYEIKVRVSLSCGVKQNKSQNVCLQYFSHLLLYYKSIMHNLTITQAIHRKHLGRYVVFPLNC